jgi:SpoVK/Ycf46/Vps4 family AAA+-type ATPase
MYDYDFTEAPVVLNTYPGFRVIEVKGRTFIDLRDPKASALREYLYQYLNNEVDSDSLEEFAHRYPVQFLSDNFEEIEEMKEYEDAEGLNIKELLAIIREDKKKRVASYAARQKKGMVEMGDIETVFPIGTEIAFETGGDMGTIGGVIRSVKLHHSFWGTYFEISLHVIHGIKGEMSQGFYTAHMAGFFGQVPLKSLPIRKVSAEDKKSLAKRGEKFAAFWKPGTYVAYKGTLVQPSWFSQRTYRADGRIVIDPISFERQEPEGWRNCINSAGVSVDREDERAKIKKENKITEKDYWRCIPQLYGFSLAVKQWGRFNIEGMEPIKWRDDAWEKLVHDEEEKDLIYSLVKFHGQGFTDIIEGKGGGTIFLLHGKPGWGKTASAEAVAELLHKPLYSVSVGELGTSTDMLEKRLRSILDVAVIWDAVLLLDEADIFLEERDEHNIARNAMVGVFLRLLEYHNGVLFLTTNRVKKIDPAFYSRISVALHYRAEGKHLKVWNNLLDAAGLDASWAIELSTFDINGRQIKNSIRMAQTLARSKGRKVLIGDLKRAATATIKFETEMKSANPDSLPAPAVEVKPKRTRKKAVAATTLAAAASK